MSSSAQSSKKPAATGRLRVWIVDDDESFRFPFVKLLALEKDIVCERQFGAAEELLAVLKEMPGPDLVLLDVNLPKMSGMLALPRIKSLSPNTIIFIWSSFSIADKETEAQSLGARAFFSKYDPYEKVVGTMRKEAWAAQTTSKSSQNPS